MLNASPEIVLTRASKAQLYTNIVFYLFEVHTYFAQYYAFD